jgi:hypothetical protein
MYKRMPTLKPFFYKAIVFSLLCVHVNVFAQYAPLLSDADFEGRQISTTKLVGVIDGQHGTT